MSDPRRSTRGAAKSPSPDLGPAPVGFQAHDHIDHDRTLLGTTRQRRLEALNAVRPYYTMSIFNHGSFAVFGASFLVILVTLFWKFVIKRKNERQFVLVNTVKSNEHCGEHTAYAKDLDVDATNGVQNHDDVEMVPIDTSHLNGLQVPLRKEGGLEERRSDSSQNSSKKNPRNRARRSRHQRISGLNQRTVPRQQARVGNRGDFVKKNEAQDRTNKAQCPTSNSSQDSGQILVQQGYKSHPIGRLLFSLWKVHLFGLNLMLWLCIIAFYASHQMVWFTNGLLQLDMCTQETLQAYERDGLFGNVAEKADSSSNADVKNDIRQAVDRKAADDNAKVKVNDINPPLADAAKPAIETIIPYCTPTNGATTKGQIWSNIGILFIIFWMVSFLFHVYYVRNMQRLRELFLLRADFLTCETVFIEQRDDDMNHLDIEGKEEEEDEDADMQERIERTSEVGKTQKVEKTSKTQPPVNGHADENTNITNLGKTGSNSHNFKGTILVEVPVQTYRDHETNTDHRFFVFQCQRYIYDYELGFFVVPENELVWKSCAAMREPFRKGAPVTEREVLHQRNLRGENLIDVEVLPFLTMVTNECLSILYVWQYQVLLMVYYYWYWHVATINLSLLGWSIVKQALLRRRSQLEIQEMARKTTDVKVLKRKQGGSLHFVVQTSEKLVAGDLFLIREGMDVPCDCVILDGTVVMNESALTGEPMPIQKFPIEQDQNLRLDKMKHGKKHYLYAGTRVMQSKATAASDNTSTNVTNVLSTDGLAIGLVLEIGAATTKGDLIRNILFPQNVSFQFETQVYLGLAIFSGIAVLIILLQFLLNGGNFANFFFECGIGISCCTSPLILVGFTDSQANSGRRMKQGKYKIGCLSLPRIVMAGKVKVQCFDKTGTLTHEGLEFFGMQRSVVQNSDNKKQDDLNSPRTARMSRRATPVEAPGTGNSRPTHPQSPQKELEQTPWQDPGQDGSNSSYAFGELVRAGNADGNGGKQNSSYRIDASNIFDVALATCHTVTKMSKKLLDAEQREKEGSVEEDSGDSDDSEEVLVGNAVECEMVKFSNLDFTIGANGKDVEYWRKGENTSKPLFTTVRQFEFDQTIQLQSVIVKTSARLQSLHQSLTKEQANVLSTPHNDNVKPYLIAKGSFEKIAARCKPDTIPHDYDAVTTRLASEGFYVIALAVRDLSLVPNQSNSISSTNRMNYLIAPRSHLEEDLHFLGLLYFKNELKADTPSHIRELRNGKIRSVIVTGDNVWTGVNIAKKCGIVKDDFVMMVGDVVNEVVNNHPVKKLRWQYADKGLDGGIQGRKSNTTDEATEYGNQSQRMSCLVRQRADSCVTAAYFQSEFQSMNDQRSLVREEMGSCATSGSYVELGSHDKTTKKKYFFALTQTAYTYLQENDPELFEQIFPRVLVFGRMTPQGKVDVVQYWQELGYIVGMCGDGGNDCAALRAAHVGLALSESDASIVSPFSSSAKSVGAVVEVIREGRCALANCTSIFKFFVTGGLGHCYSIFLASAFNIYASEMLYLIRDLLTVPLVAQMLSKSEPRTVRTVTPRNYETSGSGSPSQSDSTRKESTDNSDSLLHPLTPPSKLLGWYHLSSILIPLLTHCLFFTGILLVLDSEWGSDYFSWGGRLDSDVQNLEPSDVYAKGSHPSSQLIGFWKAAVYLYPALLYSVGGHFRKPVWANWKLVSAVIGIIAAVTGVYMSKNNTVSCILKVNCDNETMWGSPVPFIDYFLGGGSGGREIYSERFFFVESGGPWYNEKVSSELMGLESLDFDTSSFANDNVQLLNDSAKEELRGMMQVDEDGKYDTMRALSPTTSGDYDVADLAGPFTVDLDPRIFSVKGALQQTLQLGPIFDVKMRRCAMLLRDGGDDGIQDEDGKSGNEQVARGQERQEPEVVAFNAEHEESNSLSATSGPTTSAPTALLEGPFRRRLDMIREEFGEAPASVHAELRKPLFADQCIVGLQFGGLSIGGSNRAGLTEVGGNARNGEDTEDLTTMMSTVSTVSTVSTIPTSHLEFWCKSLCEETWHHGKAMDPNRFYCWYAAFNAVEKKCFVVPRTDSSNTYALGPEHRNFVRFRLGGDSVDSDSPQNPFLPEFALSSLSEAKSHARFDPGSNAVMAAGAQWGVSPPGSSSRLARVLPNDEEEWPPVLSPRTFPECRINRLLYLTSEEDLIRTTEETVAESHAELPRAERPVTSASSDPESSASPTSESSTALTRNLGYRVFFAMRQGLQGHALRDTERGRYSPHSSGAPVVKVALVVLALYVAVYFLILGMLLGLDKINDRWSRGLRSREEH